MISVIIPVYNRPLMLSRAIASVLSQTGLAVELIVIDDGSDMRMEELQAQVRDAGGQFVTQTRQGVAAARNKGLALASGEWICLLDSDDYWLPNKLAQQCAYHEGHPHFLLSQTAEVWYRHGKQVNKQIIHTQPCGPAFTVALRRCLISSSSVMLHRSVLESCGNYDEHLPVCEDYDLWLRVLSCYEVGLVPEKLVVKHGGHADQLSKSEPAMDRFRLYSLLKILELNQLTAEQHSLVLAEIAFKARVLMQGAFKRENNLAELYRKIEQEAQIAISSGVKPDLPEHSWFRRQVLA